VLGCNHATAPKPAQQTASAAQTGQRSKVLGDHPRAIASRATGSTGRCRSHTTKAHSNSKLAMAIRTGMAGSGFRKWRQQGRGGTACVARVVVCQRSSYETRSLGPDPGARPAGAALPASCECVTRGVLSGRSLLRDAQSGQTLFSCEHRALRLRFFHADSDELLLARTGLAIRHLHARLVREGREMGRLLRLNGWVRAPLVLTLAKPGSPHLALCFVLMGLQQSGQRRACAARHPPQLGVQDGPACRLPPAARA